MYKLYNLHKQKYTENIPIQPIQNVCVLFLIKMCDKLRSDIFYKCKVIMIG